MNLKIFDASQQADRDQVNGTLGEEAEGTILRWCTIDRRKEVIGRLLPYAMQGADGEKALAELVSGGLEVEHLVTKDAMMISPRDLGELIVFELCDAADQQFGELWREVLSHSISPATPSSSLSCSAAPGWQDDLMGGHFYTDVECTPQSYHEAWQVWPGLAKPGKHMEFLSNLGTIARVCKGASEEPFELPPIFNGCSETLPAEAELEARDLYWGVICNSNLIPGSPQAAEALETLARVSELSCCWRQATSREGEQQQRRGFGSSAGGGRSGISGCLGRRGSRGLV